MLGEWNVFSVFFLRLCEICLYGRFVFTMYKDGFALDLEQFFESLSLVYEHVAGR